MVIEREGDSGRQRKREKGKDRAKQMKREEKEG
jgi:hypothetical protein